MSFWVVVLIRFAGLSFMLHALDLPFGEAIMFAVGLVVLFLSVELEASLRATRIPLHVRWRFFLLWLEAGPWLRAAPSDERCIMGYPTGHRCRRATPDGGLWCARHIGDVT